VGWPVSAQAEKLQDPGMVGSLNTEDLISSHQGSEVAGDTYSGTRGALYTSPLSVEEV
jgi:hypothetical protein